MGTITTGGLYHIGPNLATELTGLFDAFVAKGPGKSQFVHIRYFKPSRCSTELLGGTPMDRLHYGPLVKLACEKMAAESQSESCGALLFRDAYQLARTVQQPASKTRGR